jgi:endonuclease/exonuclease/phosphatase family metal-dependent hydrolase
VVSNNIRWRGGEDLTTLIELFKHDKEIGGATILGLQEVDRNKKRTGYVNTARKIADSLGMYYAWAAPPSPPSDKKQTEEETGVAILSPYPLTDVKRIVLPKEGPGGRRRVAVGATILIGKKSLRVYSVHAETRISSKAKLEQFRAVLEDLTRFDKSLPTIVLGDFNTWQPDAVTETHRLFTTNNFATPFDRKQPTWRTFLIKLKLDWLWMRGLTAKASGIDRNVELSDHWPLWSEASF